jgi:hypothetical protein
MAQHLPAGAAVIAMLQVPVSAGRMLVGSLGLA